MEFFGVRLVDLHVGTFLPIFPICNLSEQHEVIFPQLNIPYNTVPVEDKSTAGIFKFMRIGL